MVTELGSKADAERDHIRVSGKLLHGAQKNVYLLMNKPKGYITAVTDPERRPTVMDLLRGVGVRVYPVGASTTPVKACCCLATTVNSQPHS